MLHAYTYTAITAWYPPSSPVHGIRWIHNDLWPSKFQLCVRSPLAFNPTATRPPTPVQHRVHNVPCVCIFPTQDGNSPFMYADDGARHATNVKNLLEYSGGHASLALSRTGPRESIRNARVWRGTNCEFEIGWVVEGRRRERHVKYDLSL